MTRPSRFETSQRAHRRHPDRPPVDLAWCPIAAAHALADRLHLHPTSDPATLDRTEDSDE